MRYLLCRLEVTSLSTPPSWGVRKAGRWRFGKARLETSRTVALVPAARDPKAEGEK
jgi:hypothetical protein